MTFNNFREKNKLINQATSNIRVQQVLCSSGLNKVGIYLRDGPFQSDIGIVILHPTKGTHRFAYTNETYFVSYGCSPPQKQSKIVMKRNGYCLYSEYKIQSITNERFLLCKFLFIYNLLDKSCRNGL